MRFPRLLLPRIAVWRSSCDLHLGGSASPVVLRRVPPQIADVVDLLDGRHPLDDLVAVCDRQWVLWLLSALESHCLVADGPAGPSPVGIRVEGTGGLAQAITDLLPGPPSGPLGECAVRIIAAPSLEADRVLVAGLHRDKVPYLLVQACDRWASVGPFVIPGQTSCVTCLDLTRRGLDPTWPVQVFQLSQRVIPPDPLLCSWASATAVAHALAYTRGLTPESASTTVELSAEDGRLTYRHWPVHPDCPCH